MDDPFTFKDDANTENIAIVEANGHLTFRRDPLTAAEIIALFKDTDMKITDKDGNVTTDIVSTGCTVYTTVNGVTTSLKIAVYGDIDGDGRIAAGDYISMKNYLKKLVVLGESNLIAADLSGEGDVSAIDTIALIASLKY